MKTLFIDCGAQLEKVFRKVHRTDDPPVTVNLHPFQAGDLPRLLDGCEICIDDHSYMPTAQIAQCKSLRHIVFCGTGASSYMDLPALAGLGITVHTYRGYGDTAVAEHTIALMFACARDIALSDRKVRGGRDRSGVWCAAGPVRPGWRTIRSIGTPSTPNSSSIRRVSIPSRSRLAPGRSPLSR